MAWATRQGWCCLEKHKVGGGPAPPPPGRGGAGLATVGRGDGALRGACIGSAGGQGVGKLGVVATNKWTGSRKEYQAGTMDLVASQ